MNRTVNFTQKLSLSLLLAFFGLATALTAQANFSEAQIQNLIAQQQQLRLDAVDYQDITISSQYQDRKTGITHVYIQQNYLGMPVKDGTMGMHFAPNGDMAHLTSNFVTNIADKVNSDSPSISAADALQAALNNLGISAGNLSQIATPSPTETVFDKGSYSIWDVPVRLVYELDNGGNLLLSWEARIYPLDEQNYWVMSMDANNGVEVARTDLVIHCSFDAPDHKHAKMCAVDANHKVATAQEVAIPAAQSGFANMLPSANFYRVYEAPVEAPTFGERTLVGTAGDPASSPLGWHDDGLVEYNITKGNNVYAYQDPGPASTGIPAVGGTPGQQPLVFDFDANLSLTPANYRDAAITNLFFWNNKIHDIFYQYGFTEEAGNFQTNNFAHGGEGQDAVLAEAQDGSGVNNANFLTLADGLPGRMQMFLWTDVPIIDGDFDNGVILHEYGHGISTRLTGGPAATCLGGGEQGGEGWSDYFAVMVTMDPATVPGIFATGRGVGSYVLGEGTDGDGIRPTKYSTNFAVNDYTYGDLTRSGISQPHGVGFIWATMLWEMTAKFVEVYGYDADITYGSGGNNMALELVVTGLKLQPCSPTFVEQRDAILAADQLLNGGANKCLIWEAFAKRGLGYSASSGTNARGDEIEAFDMPPAFCQPTVTMETEVASLAQNGSTLEVKLLVTNNASSAISGVTVKEYMPAGTSLLSASHSNQVSGQTVTFSNLTIPAKTVEEITLTLAVNTNSTAEMIHRDDMEANPFGWSASPGVDQFKWSTKDAFSGDYAWFAADPNNYGNQLLTWNQEINVTAGTHLRFAHRFNTEANFDGGLVEISTDGGTTWTDMGPLIVQNGYNDFVTAVDNTLINGFCYGGNSGGFIHTLANLSPLAGQTALVRFRLASDVLTAAEGWYIDDMEVVKDPFLIHNKASYSMANGFVNGEFEDEVLVLGAAAQRTQAPQVEVSNQFADGLEMTLAPNPATTRVQLNIKAPEENVPAQLRILNAQGKVMFQQANWQVAGTDQLQLNISDWPAGVYVTQLVQGSEQVTKRLIIQ